MQNQRKEAKIWQTANKEKCKRRLLIKVHIKNEVKLI